MGFSNWAKRKLGVQIPLKYNWSWSITPPVSSDKQLRKSSLWLITLKVCSSTISITWRNVEGRDSTSLPWVPGDVWQQNFPLGEDREQFNNCSQHHFPQKMLEAAVWGLANGLKELLPWQDLLGSAVQCSLKHLHLALIVPQPGWASLRSCVRCLCFSSAQDRARNSQGSLGCAQTKP